MSIPDSVRNKRFPQAFTPRMRSISIEYTALAVLKYCEGETYRFLHHGDAPDLQDTDKSIGIEVTRAVDIGEAQAQSEFVKLREKDDPDEKEKCRRIIRQTGFKLPEDWCMKHPSSLLKQEQDIIVHAFDSKIQKVNAYRQNGFSSVGVFIYREDPLFSDTELEWFEWLQSAQAETPDRFDFAYLCYISGLLFYDFKKQVATKREIIQADLEALLKLGSMAAIGEIKDDDPIWAQLIESRPND